MSLPAPLREVLRCPVCGGRLGDGPGLLACLACGVCYPAEEGVPRLRPPGAGDAFSERVRGFYERAPFPGYEAHESLASLRRKAAANPFACALCEQVPAGAVVLDCGCGTGQLAALLSQARRVVAGTDLCRASLLLAEGFRRRQALAQVGFAEMDLFRPCFAVGTFDLVVCTGVLHHTADPAGGLRALAPLLRPGGHLVVGLYHRFGRLLTRARGPLLRLGRGRLDALDPRLAGLDPGRREAWLRDQYGHPHESAHGFAELRGWMRAAGLEWLRTLPGARPWEPWPEDLFAPEPPAGPGETLLAEIGMLAEGWREGGLFLGIARRPLDR